MALKKALMISYYFPPYAGGGVYRILKFVKYLPRFGWEPIIITPNPKEYYWAFDHSLLNEIPEFVHVCRTRCFEPFHLFALLDKMSLMKLRNVVNQYCFVPDEKLGWLPFALLNAVNLIRKEDIKVIFTSSPPQSNHLIGYFLKKLTGKPWVADFRDQWTLNPLYEPSVKAIDVFNSVLEKSVCKFCDRLIHVTNTDRYLVSEKYGVPAEKIITIRNGYDSEDFEQELSNKNDGEFKISYFGNLYGGRERVLDNFLSGVELALDKESRLSQQLRVQFCGNVSIDKKWFQHPKISKILKIQGFISHRDAIQKMLKSSLLLFLLSANDEKVLTTKLYEYMATGKPILALIPDGEAKEVLIKSNLGFFSDPTDPENIGNVIVELFGQQERCEGLGEPNWEFITQFERKRQIEMLSFAFNEISRN